MARTWEYSLDEMIYVSGDNWMEYGRFGSDTYGLHTEIDGNTAVIRIDAASGKEATEEASRLLDKIADGWRAVNW